MLLLLCTSHNMHCNMSVKIDELRHNTSIYCFDVMENSTRKTRNVINNPSDVVEMRNFKCALSLSHWFRVSFAFFPRYSFHWNVHFICFTNAWLWKKVFSLIPLSEIIFPKKLLHGFKYDFLIAYSRNVWTFEIRRQQKLHNSTNGSIYIDCCYCDCLLFLCMCVCHLLNNNKTNDGHDGVNCFHCKCDNVVRLWWWPERKRTQWQSERYVLQWK